MTQQAETRHADNENVEARSPESNPTEVALQLRAFGDAYQYDTSYLITLLEASPEAYGAFAAGMSMSSFRDALPPDAHYVARVSAMQADDCGPCAQLNLRMAVEAGIDRALLETLVERPDQLPDMLRDVRAHTLAACRGAEPDTACADRIRAHYGEAGFAELAVCIAGSRLFPTVKRALMKAGACEILRVEP